MGNLFRQALHRLAIAAAHAQAGEPAMQKYSAKPIRFIMPYPVGGSIDLGGRTAAQQAGGSTTR